MNDRAPIIIVGAPRSGTSLIQKLIRETPGFVSVPRESGMIWMPYCHPAKNNWEYEGCPDSRITEQMASDIRYAFGTQALSADTWRLFGRLGLMERPRLAACLKLTYRALFNPWKRFREHIQSPQVQQTGRLVDKSVHAGLWLNLVDAVFPNALYIHMVRSPDLCIPSMMYCWKEYGRFGTYQIPPSVAQPRNDTAGQWCLPMPNGWREHYNGELVDLCAFQWHAINESILSYLSTDAFVGRIIRLHVEDLSTNPNTTLANLFDFLDVSSPSVDINSSNPPPIVNASHTHSPRVEIPIVQTYSKIARLYQRLSL